MFPTVQGLIQHYYTNPIRSRQRADQIILLMRPIPVDPELDARAKEMREQQALLEGASEQQQQQQVVEPQQQGVCVCV